MVLFFSFDNFDMRIYNLMMYLIFSDYFYWFFFLLTFGRQREKNTRWVHSKSSSHWFRFNHRFVWYIIKEFTWIRLEYFDKAKQKKMDAKPIDHFNEFSQVCGFTCQLHTILHTICIIRSKLHSITGHDLHVAHKLYSIYTEWYYIFTASPLIYGSKTK